MKAECAAADPGVEMLWRRLWLLPRASGGSRLRLCENAQGEASEASVSAVAAIIQRVAFPDEEPAPHAFIAAISGLAPRILIVRFSLQARTCKLISVRTRDSVLVRK